MYNVSLEVLWANELATASARQRFTLPTHERHIDLMLALREFPVRG